MIIEETSVGNLLLTISDKDKKVIEGIQTYNMLMYGESGFSMEDEKQFFQQSGTTYEYDLEFLCDKFGYLVGCPTILLKKESRILKVWGYELWRTSSWLERIYENEVVIFTRLI